MWTLPAVILVWTAVQADGPATPTVTSSSDPLDTNGSRDLTLSCSASQVNPAPPVYSWTRASSSDVIHTGQRYTFKPHPPEDDGSVYQCHAKNNFTNAATSASVAVRLNYEPVITTQPLNESNQCVLKPDGTSCEVTEGNGVYINCTSHSYPAPASTVWIKDGRKVGSGSVLSLNLANRTIHNGLYGCNVTTGNLTGRPGKGPLTKVFDLTVFVKYVPERTRLTLSDLPGNLTVTEGNSVVFACLANGRRTPSITLVKKETKTEVHSVTGGDLLLEDRDSLLNYTLTSAKCNDTGTYTCTARNDVGTGPAASGIVFVSCGLLSVASDDRYMKNVIVKRTYVSQIYVNLLHAHVSVVAK